MKVTIETDTERWNINSKKIHGGDGDEQLTEWYNSKMTVMIIHKIKVEKRKMIEPENEGRKGDEIKSKN